MAEVAYKSTNQCSNFPLLSHLHCWKKSVEKSWGVVWTLNTKNKLCLIWAFPQCKFSLEFPEISSQDLMLCYHWLSVSGNSEILHCGILIDMPYCNSTHLARISYPCLALNDSLWESSMSSGMCLVPISLSTGVWGTVSLDRGVSLFSIHGSRELGDVQANLSKKREVWRLRITNKHCGFNISKCHPNQNSQREGLFGMGAKAMKQEGHFVCQS